MNHKHLLLVAALFCCILSLPAQESWDLVKCLEHAKETNLTLKNFRLGQASSIVNLKEAQAAFLPNLNASASGGSNFGRSPNNLTFEFEESQLNQLSMRADGSIPIYQGLTLRNQLRQAKIEQEIADYNLADAENDIALQIATAYLNILLNQEILEQNQVQVQTTQEQRDRTKKLVDAGTLAQTNLLELEAQLAINQTNVVNSSNLLQMSSLQLQQLLNLDPSPNFQISVPDLPEVGESLQITSASETYQYAEGTQANILGADLSIQSAEKAIEISKGQGLPSLNFNYSAGSGYQKRVDNDMAKSLSEQLNQNFNYGFSLGVNIPLYNRRRVRSSIERSEISLRQAELNAEIERQTLRQTIEQATLDLQSVYTQYQQVERQISSLQLAFDNAQKQLELGVINSVDYLLAQNNLQRALLDKIQLKYQYHFQSKVLDFYNGKPLTF